MTGVGQGVAALAAEVCAGRRSAVAIAEETLALADAYDAVQPQTWITRLSREDVLRRAAEVDRRVAAGEDLPLAGVPFAIKDNIDLAGVPTTAACPAFGYVADESAFAVQRLIDAGAIPIGKTNLDQFATGLVGSRSPYGACACVYNRDYVSGGSSSGSAVAVAAGIVPFALGTDTAGSGRVPAAFNGLIGFKPTCGRWSKRGVVPACRSLDCVSLFTTTIADALVIDRALTAYDRDDPYSRTASSAPAAIARIGIPLARNLNWCGDGQSQALYERARRKAEQSGLALVDVDIAPLLECAKLLYQGGWVAERHSVVSDLLRDNPAAIHPVVRAIVSPGGQMTAGQAFEDLAALKGYERLCREIFGTVDALLLPTAPTIYRIDEVLAEPFGLNANLGLYTNFVNMLDLCAIAIPCGFRDNGTGFGVTLIGPAWSDPALADLARDLEDIAMEKPQLDLAPPADTVRLAVVGAHLSGMPLNWQLSSRGARLVRQCRTAPCYDLYAMADSVPPKPALVHVGDGGGAIEVEVYELGLPAFGSFTAEVPAPLAIGTLTLEDGEPVKGFVGEPRAIVGARNITDFGGWRAFCAAAEKL
ncbi:allophanate hydrolase [Sphingomonas colocasiae]|uniref:Allophanate hydrolase n=1 Tax=Sphingomonas colocasiae TaxID=1848973 RepID=A0ABS7PW42_9SPHN|nr:allophanate hydrolase [Sphingomonas colocasiae]